MLAVGVLCLSLAGCTKNSADEIVVGEYASLTGGTATFGKSSNAGVQLAAEEINASGGLLSKKLRVVVEDDQSKPEEAARRCTSSSTRTRWSRCSARSPRSRSLAAAPDCQRAGVPMISPSSTNPKVTEVGDYIFRVCFIDPFQGAVMAKFAAETLKAKKVGDPPRREERLQGRPGRVLPRRRSSELGGTIVADAALHRGRHRLQRAAHRDQGGKPEAIFVPGYYTEVGLIARQARELGITVPLLGGDGWDSRRSARDRRRRRERLLLLEPLRGRRPESRRAGVRRRSFAPSIRDVPDAMAALGYDAAQVLADAIRARRHHGGQEAPRRHRGDQGLSRRHREDHARRRAQRSEVDVVLKIDGGKVQFFQKVEP